MRRSRAVLVSLLLSTGLGSAACSALPGGSDTASPATSTDSAAPTASSTLDTSTTTTEPTTTTTAVPTTTTTEPPDPITVLIGSLTIEEKVGQLIMPVVEGTSAGSSLAANVRLGGVDTPAGLVAAYHLGGVLYLGGNIVSADQVTAFSAELQAAADPDIGLLIAVDQEGGRVQRVTDGVTAMPSARSLAGDTSAARSLAVQSAIELRAQGINVAFAPVADLTSGTAGVIGNRSYSADPATAAAMVVATVEGLQSEQVAASAKHWPGHGDTSVDSHHFLPVVDISYDTWFARERVPFEAASLAGVEMVMVGHLAMPQLDPSGTPATQSPILVQQLLREDLGFAGVVVSDALNMGALDGEDHGDVAVESLEAGIDLLLAPPDIAAVQSAIVGALRSGRLTEGRLDESVYRVLAMKARLGLIGAG